MRSVPIPKEFGLVIVRRVKALPPVPLRPHPSTCPTEAKGRPQKVQLTGGELLIKKYLGCSRGDISNPAL